MLSKESDPGTGHIWTSNRASRDNGTTNTKKHSTTSRKKQQGASSSLLRFQNQYNRIQKEVERAAKVSSSKFTPSESDVLSKSIDSEKIELESHLEKKVSLIEQHLNEVDSKR